MANGFDFNKSVGIANHPVGNAIVSFRLDFGGGHVVSLCSF